MRRSIDIWPLGYSRRERGFTFIGLIIVLVIILILTNNQMGGSNGSPPLQKMSIDRSNDTACRANRQILSTKFSMWAIDNPGRVPTVEDLERSGINVPRCTDGGTFTILPNGGIHCTKHDPPLDEIVLKQFPTEQAHAILADERIQKVLREHYPNSEWIVQ